MSDVTASYGMLLNLLRVIGIFIHYYWPFTSELLYFHQTFTNCVSNQYLYVNMPDVTASYGMPPNFITFFVNLHKIEILCQSDKNYDF